MMKICNAGLAGIILLFSFMGCTNPVNILVVAGGHSFDTTEFFDLFHSTEWCRNGFGLLPRGHRDDALGKN